MNRRKSLLLARRLSPLMQGYISRCSQITFLACYAAIARSNTSYAACRRRGNEPTISYCYTASVLRIHREANKWMICRYRSI